MFVKTLFFPLILDPKKTHQNIIVLVTGPGQGFTEEECLREMKIIEGLFEKMMACEKNMEKLFAASLEALDRAEGLNKREL